MNARKKKKRSHFREHGEPSRTEVNTFPSPSSLVCGGPSPLKNHPPTLPVPTRSAHPISPPGRRRVSSSALALQTAQKHLVWVEGTRARQDRMWKEAAACGEMRERQPQHHVHEEEKKRGGGGAGGTPKCQLPALQKGGGLGPRG